MNMHPVKFWFLCCALAAIAGCAASPEAKLKRGYDVVSGSADTTTILLDRQVISSDDAVRVHTFGTTGKATLDAGKAKLTACREAQKTNPELNCDSAVSTINLGSGVLLELERYLEAMEGSK